MATSWDFETGLQGWNGLGLGGIDEAQDSNLVATTARAHGGTTSVSVHLTAVGSHIRVRVGIPSCGSSTFDGRNRTLSFWVFLAIDTAGAPQTGHTCTPTPETSTTCLCPPTGGTPITAGQWTLVSLPVTDPSASGLIFLGIDCSVVANPSGTPWTGTMYFDDGSFQ